MTERRNAAIRKKLEAYTESHTRTKEAAIQALVREGLIMEDGKPIGQVGEDG